MEHFDPPHLAAILLTACVAIAAALLPRRPEAPDARVPGVAGALVLFGAWLGILVVELRDGFDASRDLPLHLTDWAVLAAVAALLTRWPLAVELTWFWGLAGTSWAVLSPDVAAGFDDIVTWLFFVAHGGVIAAAAHLVVGLGMHPRPGAIGRVATATVAVAAIAAVVDLVVDANYMYLRRPPAGGSLLDLMGPWPWYLASATVLALVLFVLLDLPFRRRRGD